MTDFCDLDRPLPAVASLMLVQFRSGDILGAGHLAEQILARDPRHVAALHVLALVRHRQERVPDAISLFTTAVSLSPLSGALWTHLGAALAAQGRHEEALSALEEAVRIAPEYAEGHYNLGVALQNLVDSTRALEHFQRAAALDPQHAASWYNAANLLRDAGRSGEAATHYERAVAVNPCYFKALLNWGLVQLAHGECEQAADQFARAMRLRPDHAGAHYHLGEAHRRCGRTGEACAAFRMALALRPTEAAWWESLIRTLHCAGDLAGAVESARVALTQLPGCERLAIALAELLNKIGHHGEAVSHCEAALHRHGDNVALLNHLGVGLLALKDTARALATFRRAAAVSPRFAATQNNLGAVLLARRQFEEARDAFQRAAATDPAHGTAMCNLGTACQELGDLDAAADAYDRALELEPALTDARWNRALVDLRRGDFARGWGDYESRWRQRAFVAEQYRRPPEAVTLTRSPVDVRSTKDSVAPHWRGEPLQGASLLVYAEQGLGDTIQFVRFLSRITDAARIVLECQPALVSLLKRLLGTIEIIGQGEPTPPHDFQCPLMSLPRILEIGLGDLPGPTPYLRVPPDCITPWRERLESLGGLVVGIAWQGNPNYIADSERSIPLASFAPLQHVAGVRLLSLQKGYGAEQAGEAGFPVVVWDLDTCAPNGAFTDTAAILSCIELLVTSDSAIAHLAGALGTPTWLALPQHADWRWMCDRDDSPWYPSMRLYRQRRRGDWSDVFCRIAKDLAALADTRGPHQDLAPHTREPVVAL